MPSAMMLAEGQSAAPCNGRRRRVEYVGGKYVCAKCGAKLDTPLGEPPKVTIRAASGEPNVRVLSRDGEELHRCTIK
jgi:hypothetical protein